MLTYRNMVVLFNPGQWSGTGLSSWYAACRLSACQCATSPSDGEHNKPSASTVCVVYWLWHAVL
eukprot:m.315142 g.315142  ORF g.315142 m.315142 type:complete len:64 (-) comp27518_c0_seq2:58-249(-)